MRRAVVSQGTRVGNVPFSMGRAAASPLLSPPRMTMRRCVALLLLLPALAFADGGRHLTFNRHAATARDLAIVQKLEESWGQRLADGDYWYDDKSGASGMWGGPALAVLPAGLGLGGVLPANASGGGTGVFVNGREIHPIDLQRLQALVGPVPRGRYWVDARGNAGPEGGPATINLYQRAGNAGAGPRPPDGACGGHMGPYVTYRRAYEVADTCRSLGHSAGQAYHNGDGYYIDIR